MHGEDGHYLFNSTRDPVLDRADKDYKLSRAYTELWYNFIRTG